MHYAAAAGDTSIVRLLIDRGADVNARDKSGLNALYKAVVTIVNPGKQRDTIRLLLDRGADVNVRGKGGNTLLMLAAAYDGSDIVPLLLERGADVNAKDDKGFTALMPAAMGVYPTLRRQAACIQELLSAGAAQSCPHCRHQAE